MEKTNIRELAMTWWNSELQGSKRSYFNWYKKSYWTPAQNYIQLTGREIEIIWSKLSIK